MPLNVSHMHHAGKSRASVTFPSSCSSCISGEPLQMQASTPPTCLFPHSSHPSLLTPALRHLLQWTEMETGNSLPPIRGLLESYRIQSEWQREFEKRMIYRRTSRSFHTDLERTQRATGHHISSSVHPSCSDSHPTCLRHAPHIPFPETQSTAEAAAQIAENMTRTCNKIVKNEFRIPKHVQEGIGRFHASLRRAKPMNLDIIRFLRRFRNSTSKEVLLILISSMSTLDLFNYATRPDAVEQLVLRFPKKLPDLEKSLSIEKWKWIENFDSITDSRRTFEIYVKANPPSRSSWTTDDDRLLTHLIDQNKSLHEICEHFPRRTRKACVMRRYLLISRSKAPIPS